MMRDAVNVKTRHGLRRSVVCPVDVALTGLQGRHRSRGRPRTVKFVVRRQHVGLIATRCRVVYYLVLPRKLLQANPIPGASTGGEWGAGEQDRHLKKRGVGSFQQSNQAAVLPPRCTWAG